MSSKPTIVIVPGAWHNATHYSPLTTRLESAGYEVKPLSLYSAGTNGSMPANKGDHTPDVQLVSSTISAAVDAGNDVVVVMHSAGGVTGSEGTIGLSKAERSAAGKPGGVTHLVYLTAFAIPVGPGIYSEKQGPAEWIAVDHETGTTLPKDPLHNFYHDCDPAEAAKAIKGMGRHSYAAMWTCPTYAAWQHIPSTYLVCEEDRAIPVAVQDMWCNQEGANFDVVRCKAAHSPFMSMPDFTAEVVRKAAGEKI